MNEGLLTIQNGHIILWAQMDGMVLPIWGWDNWEEVDLFIENLLKLKSAGIPEVILKEFE